VSTLTESTEGVVTVVVETDAESPSVLVSSVVEAVLQEAKKATTAKIKSTFFIIILIFDFFLFLLYIIKKIVCFVFFYLFLDISIYIYFMKYLQNFNSVFNVSDEEFVKDIDNFVCNGCSFPFTLFKPKKYCCKHCGSTDIKLINSNKIRDFSFYEKYK